MPRKYDRPPLLEALCEFRFEPRAQWDWTVPGLLYERIKGDFPEKRQQNVLAIQVFPPNLPAAQQQTTSIDKMQFLNREQNAIVQVGPDLLAVNQLRPYPGWESFKPAIIHKLELYCDIAKPNRIAGMTLRYLNRIDIASREVRLEDYFMIYPRLPANVPQTYQTFLQQVEVPYENPRGLLKMVFSPVPAEATDATSFLVDLAFGSTRPDAIENAANWIEAVHSSIEGIFDACFTEKTHKEVFREVLHEPSAS